MCTYSCVKMAWFQSSYSDSVEPASGAVTKMTIVLTGSVIA